MAVGIPLPDVGATFFEVVPLDELSRTLGSVRVSLLGARRHHDRARRPPRRRGRSPARVQPLADAAQAAQAIAGGRLDTRLEASDDPDLQRAGRRRSTTWPRRCRSGSSATPASPSDVSHELRSPLTTLAASVEVLDSRRDELPDEPAAALDLLVADVGRFQSLVEDLLEISRFDAGAVRLHRRTCSWPSSSARPSASAAGADVPVEVDAERPRTWSSRPTSAAWPASIANLLDNARYYGGGEVTVTVEPSQPEGEEIEDVQIAVEDHGPGVPPDERQLDLRAVRPRRPAGRRGSSEGAGLGLALVDEHVRPPRRPGVGRGPQRRRGGGPLHHRAPGGARVNAADRRPPPRRLRRVLASIGAVVATAALAAACGLPTDSSPRDIPPEYSLGRHRVIHRRSGGAARPRGPRLLRDRARPISPARWCP